MRFLPLLLLAAAVFPTAHAQVRLEVLANTGYDFGYAAPSVGAGTELSWEPPGAAVRLGVRLSGDYVFADDLPYAVPFSTTFVELSGRQTSVVRLGAEAVVHWETAPLPVTPYGKVGLARETERFRFPEADFDYTATDAVVGLGLVWGVVYVEGTYGGGDASRERIAVGLTF